MRAKMRGTRLAWLATAFALAQGLPPDKHNHRPTPSLAAKESKNSSGVSEVVKGQPGGIAYLRIEKTASTTFMQVFQTNEPRFRQLWWGDHRDYYEFTQTPRPRESFRRLVLTVREPAARFVSEYLFCTTRGNCVVQGQWDYKGRRQFRELTGRLQGHLDGASSLSLAEFATLDGPAANRMAEYMSGHRYGRHGGDTRPPTAAAALACVLSGELSRCPSPTGRRRRSRL